jgi:outer membrane protein assembly factor BamB
MLLMGAGRGRGSALLDFASGNPQVVWENGHLAGVFQTGVLIDGHVYSFGRERRRQPLQCVELVSGELKWSQELGEWGSLIAADNKLIIVTGDGRLVVAKANPEGYSEIVSAKVFDMKDLHSYPRREPNACWTAPVLANGRVYARNTYGDLVCVDLNA